MSKTFRSGPARDFTKVGEICAPPFAVLPDPEQVFAHRAERLRTLAEGHDLAPFLIFLSRLVEIQRQGVSEPPPQIDRASAERSLAHGMPALSKNMLVADDDFSRILDWFLSRAAVVEGPPAARQAIARVMAMSPADRLTLAESIFEAAYPADQIGETLYVAAGLQVYLTRLAAGLDASSLRPVDAGVCPVCGGLPVASSIVGWTQASRARYCCCGLCATRWNYVRVKCVICGSTEGVSQRLIDELSKDVVAEICDKCHGYTKQFREDRQPEIEPLADDIASFGLDLLVREQGYARLNSNPLMIVVAPSP